jgi:hypothetical protein
MTNKTRIEPPSVMPTPRSSKTAFPLGSLKACEVDENGNMVGPSIYGGKYTEELREAANGQIQYYKKKHPGTNFTVRKCPDGILRIWRTA